MADGITLSAGTADGAKIATDDQGASGHVQYIKPMFGGDGTFTIVTSSVGLPVDLLTATVAVTQSGTWDEVGINDSGNSITVDQATGTNLHMVLDSGTVTAVTTLTGGGVAHDGAGGAVKPHLIGFFASAAAPTDVSGDGDATQGWSLRNGAQVVNLSAAGALIGATSNALDVNIKSSATLTVNAHAVTVASGGIASGAIASGAVASGAYASGAFASGSVASGAFASGSIADGAQVTLGAKADAKSTATDTTAITIMQVLKQISASVQAPPSQAVTNAGTFAAQAVIRPETSGGLSTFMASGSDGSSILVATKQTITASAGQLYGYYAYNPEAAASFVHFYNTDTVTVGTTNPLVSFAIPAGAAANLTFPIGVAFSTAISCAATTTAGGNSAPATGVSLVAWFK